MMRRNLLRPAQARESTARRTVALRVIAILLLVGLLQGPDPAELSASPGHRARADHVRNDIPDWLSAETASRLSVGFDVLLPTDVPAPFSGEPAVDAYDGYYSLYWLIPGAPPTYLLITGEAGGTIPDFSFYDRNVQLKINADVQGSPAYHDLTPIYDKVYWQVGDVVYTVDSHNLTATDSLTLANSLVSLGPVGGDTGGDQGDGDQAPALGVPDSVQSGATVAIGVSGVANATLAADAGVFPASGNATLGGVSDGSYDWQAPATDTDLTVTFALVDSDSGERLASARTVVLGTTSSGETATAELNCPTQATAGKERRISIAGSGTLTVDASDGTFPIEPPNTDFAPNADGSDMLTGTLPSGGAVSLAWLAPEAEMSAYIFVRDQAGNTLAECGIEVIFGEVPDEPTPTPTRTPIARAPGVLGDGTWLDDKFDAVVATVLAYGNPPAGDATGGPDQTNASGSSGSSAAATVTPTSTPAKPTPVPTATYVPVVGVNGLVSQEIGPDGGQLTCPSGSGATLTIPPKALQETASIRIVPVKDTTLPTVSGVRLIPGTGFDVSIADLSGKSIDKLRVPATFTVTLPADAGEQGLMLYRVSSAGLAPLSGVRVEGGTVSASLDGYARVVAGIPTSSASAATTRDPTPFILAALGFVIALMVVVGIGSALMRRRPRTVTPRRTAPSRARIR